MSSSQRPLPNNTQHSQQTNIHAPMGFEPTISAGERPPTYDLDGEATGTSDWAIESILKAIPLQAWTGPEVSRRLRLPDFKTFRT